MRIRLMITIRGRITTISMSSTVVPNNFRPYHIVRCRLLTTSSLRIKYLMIEYDEQ